MTTEYFASTLLQKINPSRLAFFVCANMHAGVLHNVKVLGNKLLARISLPLEI
jgi:hypothetical protein